MKEFNSLGQKVGLQPVPDPKILETFGAPIYTKAVTLETKEFTSLCPITGQPDFATITISYVPDKLCLESKSLKLYLQSYRNEKAFIELLANKICHDIYTVLGPFKISVTIESNPRGGVGLKAQSIIGE